MAVLGTYSGVGIDPALLFGIGYMDPVTVNSVSYPRWMAYLIALSGNLVGAGMTAPGLVTATFNEFTSVSPGAQAGLPFIAPIGIGVGRTITVVNGGGNALTVMPASGQFINNLAVNTGVSIAIGAASRFVAVSSSRWRQI